LWFRAETIRAMGKESMKRYCGRSISRWERGFSRCRLDAD
jgi:hypothetical protein